VFLPHTKTTTITFITQKDLVYRLRKMANVIQHVNEDSPEWKSPEMDALCHGLIQLVNHRDKEVRLYTVLLCMELFSIYAPDAPWDNKESLDIFRQTIRQLANLAHTTQPNQSHFAQYLRILELLAEVKIGIVLVELTKKEPETRNKTSHASRKGEDPLDQGGMDEHHNNNDKSQQDQDEDEEVADVGVEAMAVLKELIRTMLQSVQLDHPPEIAEMVQKTITSCLEEYYEGVLVPTTLLDELLVCIGQGRTVLVTNPAFSVAVAQRHREQQQQLKSGSKKQDKKRNSNSTNLPPLPPRQMEQVNPAYIVAASVVRKSVDRLSTPIATLLNGLLNGDPRIMEESDLLVHTEEPATNDPDKPDSDHTAASARSSPHPIPLLLDTPQPQQQSPTTTVWTVILEFHKIAPSILTTIIGTVATQLTCPDESKRCLVVRLLGRLFVSKLSTMAVEYSRCLSEWMKRIHDISPKIRRTMVDYLLKLVVQAADRSQNQTHYHASDWKEIWERAQSVLGGQLDVETDSSVRLHVLHQVCDTAYAHRQVISAELLRRVAHRVTSKHKQERRDALTGLAQTYFKQYVSHQLRPVQEGGDDVELSVILEVLHRTCARHAPSNQSSRKNSSVSATASEDQESYDCYQWIPRTIMKCSCYKDSVDSEMHSRVVQVVDDLLLGSELSNSTKKLTPTARAVGLAIVIDSLQQQSPSSHPAVAAIRSSTSRQAASAGVNDGLLWLCFLMAQRSKLQKALGHYLDARSQIKLHPRGRCRRRAMN
jgi:hypothetical protein